MKTSLVGRQFGLLTVVRLHSKVGYQSKWVCLCSECGGERVSFGHHLLATARALCPHCQHVSRRHGKTASRAYNAWAAMKKRCLNPNTNEFRNYGGRGIAVCERWLTFDNFYADMGDPPPGLSLDRFPNNNGNYEPNNCRWATRVEQAANRRTSFATEIDGRVLGSKEAAAVLGITPQAVRRRVSKQKLARQYAAN